MINREDVSLHSRIIKVFDKSLFDEMSRLHLQQRLFGSCYTTLQMQQLDETLNEMVDSGLIHFRKSDGIGISMYIVRGCKNE